MKAKLLMITVGLLAALGILACSQFSTKRMPITPAEYSERPPVTDSAIARGKEIYELSCIMCHGVKGKGDGPAAFFVSRTYGPRPRVFTDGVFKFRSTPTGELPTDEDLFRTVSNGVPGFMPPFGGMETADRWQVIYYVKSFFPGFEDANPEPIEIVDNPIPTSAASVQKGYEIFRKLKCADCHGGGGEGDGPSAPDLKDDWGFLLPSADLTRPSSFKNGNRPEDIYRTLVTGLDGSGMPSYAAVLEGKEEDLWNLVNYISSLSRERR